MTQEEIEKLEQTSEFETVGQLMADLQRRIDEGLSPDTRLCCQTSRRGDSYGRVTYGIMIPVRKPFANDVQMLADDIENVRIYGCELFFGFMFF